MNDRVVIVMMFLNLKNVGPGLISMTLLIEKSKLLFQNVLLNRVLRDCGRSYNL